MGRWLSDFETHDRCQNKTSRKFSEAEKKLKQRQKNVYPRAKKKNFLVHEGVKIIRDCAKSPDALRVKWSISFAEYEPSQNSSAEFLSQCKNIASRFNCCILYLDVSQK